MCVDETSRRVNGLNYLHLNGFFKNLHDDAVWWAIINFLFVFVFLYPFGVSSYPVSQQNPRLQKLIELHSRPALAINFSSRRFCSLAALSTLLAQFQLHFIFMWEKLLLLQRNIIFFRCTTNQLRQQFMNFNHWLARFIFLLLFAEVIYFGIIFSQPSRAPSTIITK